MKIKLFYFALIVLSSLRLQAQEKDSLQTEFILSGGKIGVGSQHDLIESVTVRYAFNSHLELGLSISPFIFLSGRRESIYQFGLSLRYYFIKSDLTPFIGGTFYGTFVRSNTFGDIETEYGGALYALHFGLQHFVTKKLVIFSQATYLITGSEAILQPGVGLSFYF